MKITKKEIAERMSWSLSQKIDHSLYIIDAFLGKYPNAVISFSGGIDSTVLLYLVKLINPNTKAVFGNTTNEFSEIIRFVKEFDNVLIIQPEITFEEIIKKYGFPLISKKVSNMIHTLQNPNEKNAITRNLYLTGIKQDGGFFKRLQITK